MRRKKEIQEKIEQLKFKALVNDYQRGWVNALKWVIKSKEGDLIEKM